MRIATRIVAVTGGCLAWALSSAALAQSLPDMTGVVQIHAGAGRFSADGHTDDRWGELENLTEVGGFAAVAFTLGDKISVQADLWSVEVSSDHIDKWDGDIDSYDAGYTLEPSLAGHVALRLNDDAMIGVMASKYGVGKGNHSPLYTVALEGAATGDKWRVASQAGVTRLDAPASSIVDEEAVYGWARYAYYLHSNLSVAADVGASRYTMKLPSSTTQTERFGVGARVEYKPDGILATGFISYDVQGRWESDNYWGSFRDGVSHKITLGVRMAFGTGVQSLQATDRRIGLHDANPLYGVHGGSR